MVIEKKKDLIDEAAASRAKKKKVTVVGNGKIARDHYVYGEYSQAEGGIAVKFYYLRVSNDWERIAADKLENGIYFGSHEEFKKDVKKTLDKAIVRDPRQISRHRRTDKAEAAKK